MQFQRLISKLQEKLSVPITWCKPLISIQYGYGGKDRPDFTHATIRIASDVWCDNAPMPSLYLNGVFFMSLRLPFFINVMIRWGGATADPAFLQTHIGWRPVDGCPVAVFRIQSDASAQGGLAVGFEDGPK